MSGLGVNGYHSTINLWINLRGLIFLAPTLCFSDLYNIWGLWNLAQNWLSLQQSCSYHTPNFLPVCDYYHHRLNLALVMPFHDTLVMTKWYRYKIE